ncbi:hypothetical protein GGTG_05363 [Gaeumannomyces tritici R3-111a-1]|uniref:Kinetochore protein mis14 n=1 Tax=Gaeumannomyces tritici (strain R3-111a-1) TaxID=644352 RepID=J3NVQ0_GAET3|nr:hypothetical protein GGTG_05363 [Gaeumannomyces tritici R3-111a-1]EJT75428.1 hypothetical protein GGTG_05363 [Gaeumannomyces tritici R3-111a-1]
MDGVHRKVELQSPEDFAYLLGNVRRAAQESIGAAFPPVEGAGEDELRVRIEELVNEYIAKTFTLAAPNISINGLPVPDSLLPKPPPKPNNAKKNRRGRSNNNPPQEEEKEEEVVYEPFDARLRDRIPDLLREEEDLLREIAALKRRVPAAAASRLADSLRAGRVAGPGAVARDLAERSGGARTRVLDVGIGVGEEGSAENGGGGDAPGVLQRPAEAERAFASAVDGLARLKRDMPATVARMERARAAGTYVIAGP